MVDDEALVNKFKEGDLSAFDQLMNKYRKSIYYLAFGMTNSHEDAEDISQEVFARVFTALPKWKPRASFYTWLRTIATNLCIDYHRTRIRHQIHSLDDKEKNIMETFSSSASDPLKTTESEELMHNILLAAEKLSPRQRDAFMLFHYGDLSLKETAAIMGCAEGTIKAHLSRATAKMRDLLRNLADEWKVKGKD